MTFVLSLFLYLPIVPIADGGMVVLLADAKGLVPCGGPSPEVPCNACHAMTMVNGLISYLFTIVTFLAVMVMMYAGFKLVTSQGNASEWEEAKGMLTNIIVGFVIVLSAWLVVDTIMKGLLDSKAGFGTWNELSNDSCTPPETPKATASQNGSLSSTGQASASAVGKLTDAQARAQLASAGISVNKTVAQGTSLENINSASIADAIALKQACNCEVRLTGGTESGHASGVNSHGSGNKYDIGLDSGVDTFITKQYVYSGTRSDGAVLYKSPSGSVYAKEGNHWDVLVK